MPILEKYCKFGIEDVKVKELVISSKEVSRRSLAHGVYFLNINWRHFVFSTSNH